MYFVCLSSLSTSPLDFFLTDICRAAEAFVVCQHFKKPEGFEPADLQHLMQGASLDYFGNLELTSRRMLVPFLACGDLSGWDADQSYDLPEEGYQRLNPVQPPTAPAYKTAIQRSKQSAAMKLPS